MYIKLSIIKTNPVTEWGERVMAADSGPITDVLHVFMKNNFHPQVANLASCFFFFKIDQL